MGLIIAQFDPLPTFACRCRGSGVAAKGYRWQASSHRGSGSFSTHSKSVGAWLASDEGDWMSVFNRWQASSHKTQCPQGIFGGLSDQKLAGVLALMISASSAPIFLKRWGSVVGK